MKYFRFFLCAGAGVVFFSIGLFGQFLNHPLSVSGGDFVSYIPKPEVPDTLRTLAIMVQFQPDQDSRTTGDGQFDLSDSDAGMLNPPPHNATYFEYHLEFARRYYQRVSGGRLTIEYRVWDQIFTLSDVMGAYSPRTPGDFSEIGKLFEEAWQRAAAEAPGIPFEDFDTFVIFHAGVGRDIDLTGIYGFDPTPLDIPSLFLGPQSLKRIFGNDYEGVEVEPGGFRIMNSMILPETQNRELDLITGRQLLQLGMNGLVCAMFGSRLGLPDLFNTDTGRSGIGRFGLMDGQAIFSFLGLFPPEPSAWEKYYLGWIEPLTVTPGDHVFNLHAAALRHPDSIVRVPINEREYYLVENRHRNPFGTGQELTIIQNGIEVTFRAERDRRGFNAFDISDITGIVLDAEVYDWSLPGGYVEADDIFYDGGILIWHVDERIIEARIGENRINADIENRGIRVVEADGSQDIGRVYEFLQPGQGSEDGTQFDFWYNGNPSPVYQNRFDANTIPVSRSNTGAPSNIALFDFSERNPVMSFHVRIGSDHVTLLRGFPAALRDPGMNSSPGSFPDGILIVDDGVMKVVSFEGEIISDQDAISGNITGTPAWYRHENTIYLYSRIDGDRVASWRCEVNDQGIYRFELVADYSIGEKITAGPVMISSDNLPDVSGDILIGTEEGSVYVIGGTGYGKVASVGNEPVLALIKPGPWVAVGERSAVSHDRQWNFPEPVRRAVGVMNDANWKIFALGDEELFKIQSDNLEIVERYRLPLQAAGQWGIPIAHDVNRDGLADILVVRENYLYVLNQNGSVLDNFPVWIGEHDLGGVYAVAADLNDDRSTETIVGNNNNMLLFPRNDGRVLPGSPVAVGERVIGSPMVFEYEGKMSVAVITGDNLLYAYSFSGEFTPDAVHWGEEAGSRLRTNVYRERFERRLISDEFLPQNRAYNWPNPVYDGTTNIRYYLSENADVSISIYEMNGERVTSFAGPGSGGIDNEIAWDASGVHSGVYLARIEARSMNQTNVVFVKIAVVR
jgi:hypothetical protein